MHRSVLPPEMIGKHTHGKAEQNTGKGREGSDMSDDGIIYLEYLHKERENRVF